MYEFTHRIPRQPFHPGSRNEDEYFARLELERRLERARRRAAEREHEERERLRALHRDHCPSCGTTLEAVRFQEGEARQCPGCYGVWMGRDLFARLTHPVDEERGYLAELLRGLLLEWTLGRTPRSAAAAGDEPGRSERAAPRERTS